MGALWHLLNTAEAGLWGQHPHISLTTGLFIKVKSKHTHAHKDTLLAHRIISHPQHLPQAELCLKSSVPRRLTSYVTLSPAHLFTGGKLSFSTWNTQQSSPIILSLRCPEHGTVWGCLLQRQKKKLFLLDISLSMRHFMRLEAHTCKSYLLLLFSFSLTVSWDNCVCTTLSHARLIALYTTLYYGELGVSDHTDLFTSAILHLSYLR